MRFLDYGKAITIMVVIIVHMDAPFQEVAAFHMMFFFFASGYVQKISSRPFKEYAKRRFRAIIIPFWYATLILGALEIARAYYFGYGDWRIFLLPVLNAIYGSGHLPYLGPVSDYVNSLKGFHPDGVEGFTDVILPMTCHLWFLPAMFVASVLFFVYVNRIRKGYWTDVIAILLLCLLAYSDCVFAFQLPYAIGRGFWGCAGMVAGYAIKKSALFITGKRRVPIFLITAAVGILLALAGITTGMMAIVSYYGPYGPFSVLLTVVGGISSSIAFCYLLYAAEQLLNGHDGAIFLIGRNLMPLYLWHMPVINAFSIALLLITQTPPSYNYSMVSVLPDEWVFCKCLLVAATVGSILLACKLTRHLD